MKKTLIAAGVLAAFAGSAFAGVTVYGKVDTGLRYTHVNYSDNVPAQDDSSFEMVSGLRAGSRLGFKGQEDLGNGMYASFRLENGFSSDNGALGAAGSLFNREASLTLGGDFGAVSFGRMGALNAGAGTTDMWRVGAEVFDGAFNADAFLNRSRYNNMISYVSPEFAGTTLYAQYSLGTADDAGATRDNNRYAALGAKATMGNVQLVAVVDSVMYEHDFAENDSLGISLGGNVALGDMKVFAAAQYGKNERNFANMSSTFVTMFALTENTVTKASEVTKNVMYKGYMLNVGMAMPVMGGDLQAGAYVADLEGSVAGEAEQASNYRYGATVAYVYNLSKRTNIGGAMGYNIAKFDDEDKTFKSKNFVAGVSLQHNF